MTNKELVLKFIDDVFNAHDLSNAEEVSLKDWVFSMNRTMM